MNLGAYRQMKGAVTTTHGRIATVDAGSGEPIIFLHGVPLNGAHWRGVIGELSASFRCIAPDLLGLGDTERDPASGLDFTAQALMILELASELNAPKFHLVGNDSGGAIAQIVACRAPERVLSLTLTNCDVDANVPPPAFAQAFALAKSGLFSRALHDLRDNLALARSDFGLGVGFEHPQHITKELVDAYVEPLLSSPERRADVDAYVAAFDSSHMIGIRGALSQLHIPTQILWGADDVFFRGDEAAWLASTIPSCKRWINVPGARLFFCEERPQWVARRIAEFVDGRFTGPGSGDMYGLR